MWEGGAVHGSLFDLHPSSCRRPAALRQAAGGWRANPWGRSLDCHVPRWAWINTHFHMMRSALLMVAADGKNMCGSNVLTSLLFHLGNPGALGRQAARIARAHRICSRGVVCKHTDDDGCLVGMPQVCGALCFRYASCWHVFVMSRPCLTKDMCVTPWP